MSSTTTRQFLVSIHDAAEIRPAYFAGHFIAADAAGAKAKARAEYDASRPAAEKLGMALPPLAGLVIKARPSAAQNMGAR